MEFISKAFNELTAEELYEILKSRAEIFIFEQNIYYPDIDDVDYISFHCFLKEGKRVIAYLRAFYEDDDKNTVKIGRVLTLNHGNGIGMKLMEQSITAIKEIMKCQKISLDAQVHAVGFYEKSGFKTVSEEFLEAGIPHVRMELKYFNQEREI